MSDFTELERLINRMSEVYEELCTLPEGPSERRMVLLAERDRVRAEASLYHSAADEAKAKDRLRAELEALRRRRDQLATERPGLVGTGGRTSGGWSRFVDHPHDVTPALSARICAVEDLLAGQPSSRQM